MDMQPTEMHLAAAKRWIESNGYPKTEEQRLSMVRDVVLSVTAAVEVMTEKTLQAMDDAKEDRKHGGKTISGQQGEQFIRDVYRIIATRNNISPALYSNPI